MDRRLSPITVSPILTEDSVIGQAQYAIVQGKLPGFLKFDPATGIISGLASGMKEIGTYGPYAVSVTDGSRQTPVISNPFSIRVEDRAAVTITQTRNTVERYIGNGSLAFKAENAIQGASFSIVDRGSLPPGLSISPHGYLIGSTTDPVGTTYANVRVRAVDGIGYAGETVASFTVIEPRNIGPIDGGFDRTIVWTVGRPLVDQSVTRVANTFGEVRYAVGSSPFPLSIDNGSLELSGTPSETGTFEVPYSVSDDTDRPSVGGTLKFVIQPAMEAGQTDVTANRGAPLQVIPTRLNGVGPFKWEILSGMLPEGSAASPVKFDGKTGAISGKPGGEGVFPLVLRVTDATRQAIDLNFRITVGSPLPFSFTYSGQMTYGQPSQSEPSSSNSFDGIDWTLVSGNLPDGVSFETAGLHAGSFTGIPRVDGRFSEIKIKGIDRGTQQEWIEDVTLEVRRSGLIGLADLKAKHRAGPIDGIFDLSATNVTLPATYALVDNAYGSAVAIDQATGNLSVSFADTGRRSFKYSVTDLFGRTRTASIILDVVGPLEIAVAAENAMKQYVQGATPITVRNLIGTPSWSLASGSVPQGTVLGEGGVTGTPETVGRNAGLRATVTDTYDGSSVTTNEFAIDVTDRDPLILSAADYSMNLYRPVAFAPTVTNAVGSVEYSITPELPIGLSFDAGNGAITGTSDAMFDGDFTITAVDTKGGDRGTSSATFNLKITDRLQPEIASPSALMLLLNHDYALSLRTLNVLGEVSWSLKSGSMPDGVTFDPVHAAFVGKPTRLQNAPGITIEIVDMFKGIETRSTKTFNMEVRQDGSPITLSLPSRMPFRVGEFHGSQAPIALNTVGDVTWNVEGLEGTSLSLDPSTGIISGTPSATGTWVATLTAKDVSGRDASQTVPIIIVPPISIRFPTENNLTYNYSFDGTTPNSLGGSRPPIAQPFADNIYGTARWSITPASGLPAGLSFNAINGRFDGRPLQIGQTGPFTVQVEDDLPGATSLRNVFLDVSMNDDPIDLLVKNYLTKVGFAIRTETPTYDNELGAVTFFPENNDLAGTNLAIDPATGVITGSFEEPQDRSINVAISDEYTTRVTSRPLSLKVLPVMTLTAPESSILEAQTSIQPVKITAANVAGSLEYSDLDAEQRTKLPEGLQFDPLTGSFTGTTDEIGSFGPFVITGRDRFEGKVDEQKSNDIMLELRPGAIYLNLRKSELAEGTKRITPYSFDFKQNLDLNGIDENSVYWAWTAVVPGTLPAGLTLNPHTGVVSGTPIASGDFNVSVTASANGKTSTKVFALRIVLPETKLELAAGDLPEAERNVAYSHDMKTALDVLNIPLSGVTLNLTANPQPGAGEAAGLPQGLRLDSDGMLTGTPTKAGTFRFAAKAEWADNNPVAESKSDSAAFVIVVNGVSYKFSQISHGVDHACAIDGQGKAFCWGSNANGQLGNGTQASSKVPVEVSNLSGVKSLSSGNQFSCALLIDGSVKCWGQNWSAPMG